MKIKEVIEKTKLTDRAIRFYIDNGLVSPGIEENYSGRKNIEFSDKDVERLSQIALLRKAGFSISDIKEIISENGNIKEVISRFVETTTEEIRTKSEVIEKLKTISFDEKVSLKTLCEKLSPTVEEEEVPKEDSSIKNFGRVFFKGFGIAGMVFSVATVIAMLILVKVNFIHFRFGWEEIRIFLISNVGMFLTFTISSVLLLLNSRKKKINKTKTSAKSAVLTFIIIPLAFFSFCFSFVIQILGLTKSETTSIDDYRVWDIFVHDFEYAEKVDLLFPDEIPPSAKKNTNREFEESAPFTTKYYYRHTFCLDPDLDIVAEWKLNNAEYEAAIKNAEAIGNFETIQKGNWTCLYFGNTNDERQDWSSDNYCFLIFAYNDKTNMVRYIASYAIDSYDYGPYHLSLDW